MESLKKTQVYLIRHAEAEGNLNNTFQGRTDAPITERGRVQIALLGERFRKIKLDAVYASPLQRAKNTAMAVAATQNLPVIEREGLLEIDGGAFEGKCWSEIPLLYPEEHDIWANRPYEFQAIHGESMRTVYDRMKRAVAEIVRENAGGTVAVVSHGCAIRAYLCYAAGRPFSCVGEEGWAGLENTSVALLEYDDEGTPRIVYRGDASHLSEDTMTMHHQTWWKKEGEA